MKKILLDIEVYKNLFLCSIKELGDSIPTVFEISSRKNNASTLLSFLKEIDGSKKVLIITFNGNHYDLPILNYILKSEVAGMMPLELCSHLKELSDDIISSELFPEKLKKYKYHNFLSLDLYTMLWSRELRIAKGISLKKIGIQIGYPVTMELPYSPDTYLTSSQIDEVIEYNSIHDLGIMEMLINTPFKFQGKKTTVAEQYQLRVDAIKRYNFPLYALSWDGVKLGFEVLFKTYCQKYGLDYYQAKNSERPDRPVRLSDIIFPKINFRQGDETYIPRKNYLEFKSFYGLLKYLKNLTVSNTNEISARVFHKGTVYDIKSGGLHTVHSPEIIKPTKDEIYHSVDVTSYYPSIGIQYNVDPEGFEGLSSLLNEIKSQRVEAKSKGDASTDRLLKLALNGGYFGSLNSQTNPLRDMSKALTITINGQLMLLMLAERLSEIGCKIDSANTDGLEILYPKKLKDRVLSIMQKWEAYTGMELEHTYYKLLVRNHVNDYIAITVDGNIKTKGSTFTVESDLGNSSEFSIVSETIVEFWKHYAEGKPFDIDEYIHKAYLNPEKWNYFLATKKVAKKFEVTYNGKPLSQTINRYFVSKRGKGGYLKKNDGGTEYTILKEPIVIYNNHTIGELLPDSIDLSWYSKKVKEAIIPLLNTTQTLF